MNKIERIISSVIDFIFISLVSLPFIAIELICLFYGYNIVMYTNLMAFSLILSIFICKDILSRQTIGKAFYNLRVENVKSIPKPEINTFILRNITIIIWPIELILMFIGDGKRIGDIIFDTRVVHVGENHTDEFVPILLTKKFVIILLLFVIQIAVYLLIILFTSRIFPVFRLLF